MRSLYAAIMATTCLVTVFSSSTAQAPDSLSFQGYITDDSGVPINDPSVSMTFKLYEGSSEIWSETQGSVPVVDGIFNVLLGSAVRLDTVRFNRPLFLGITVGGDPEIVPRTQMAATTYARALPGLYTYFHRDVSAIESYNVIGGATNNVADPAVTGATIGGGGGDFNGLLVPNTVLGTFGTISGGRSNIAGGFESTVGGGGQNRASGLSSVVGGGSSNVSTQEQATVPGGTQNAARGRGSFAAGRMAKANHDGAFVWNDWTTTGIADSVYSTANNQFLIRTAGGVGINTNQPLNSSKLHLEHGPMTTAASWGLVLSNSSRLQNRVGMRLSDSGYFEITNAATSATPDFARLDSGGNWTVVSDRRHKTDIEPASGMLQSALKLEPVRFFLKNQDKHGEKSLGMIAQQVKEVVPSLVMDGDPMTLNYAGLSVVAIGAIQDLYELVKQQQLMLEELQAENKQMRAAMDLASSR